MFQMLFSLRGLAIGAAIAFAVGSWSGYRVTAWYYQVTTTKQALAREAARAAALEENLRVIREALLQDGKSAEIDTHDLEELAKHAQEIIDAATNRPALSADAVRRLRDHFSRSK